MPQFINIYDAKAQLSKLIAHIQTTGESVVICRNNKPVVDLVPHHKAQDPLVQDPQLQGAIFRSDPCEPIGMEDWPEDFR